MMTSGPGSAPPATYDSTVLAAVLVECRELTGAHVQRVLSAGGDGIALSLRAGGRTRMLVLAASARWGRMYVTDESTPSEATPFAQMVRRRLERAMLHGMSAPPFERVVTCRFDTLEGACELILELTGRSSNLILGANGTIIGALRPTGADAARARLLLPGSTYVAPPQPKPTPATVGADALRGTGSATAWKAVLEGVAGVGPALAAEACVRAGLDPNGPLTEDAAPALVAALRDIASLVCHQRFAPTLYFDRGGAPVAYAAFPLAVYGSLRRKPVSMSEAVEAVTARDASRERFEAARRTLAQAVSRATARVRRALDYVARDLRDAQEAARLRERGELILAYLTQIPRGASAVDLPGFDGRPVRIDLDPSRSGVENAQAYFRRYAKAQATLRRLPARQGALQAEHAFLQTAATAAAQAESEDDLYELEQDLIAGGVLRRGRMTGRPRPVPARRAFDLEGGHQTLVGRSARENDHLTFQVARPGDLWLHARGMPGAHVILRARAGPPAEDAIEAAARIAAYYSAGRSSGKVPVDVTERRYVRRLRGGRPGQVVYSHERTLLVPPALPDEAATRS